MAPVTVALAGLGGYGNVYLRLLLGAGEKSGTFQFVAGIDPYPEGCEYLKELEDMDVALFSSLDQFYRQMGADLLIIAAPIHLHASMTQQALSRGSYVLCEKPLTASVHDARAMKQAETESGLQVAIGFQWSYSHTITRLKNDILKGRFGVPRRFKNISLGPRKTSYYQRASWAGRIRTDDGRMVLDSPVSNAAAHYLHNMLYLLGREKSLSLIPETVSAETYRAKNIENYDTAALRFSAPNDVELLFYATHSTLGALGPMMSFEFDDAVVLYASGTGRHMIVRFNDGHIEDYGDPNDYLGDKLWQTIEAVRTGAAPRCGIDAAAAHILCVDAVQKSEIVEFPEELIRTTPFEDDTLVHVQGLEEALLQCCSNNILPSEHGGIAWASKAKRVELEQWQTE